MRLELPSSATGVRETEAVYDVVQSCFEKLKKRFARYAAFAQRVLENGPEARDAPECSTWVIQVRTLHRAPFSRQVWLIHD